MPGIYTAEGLLRPIFDLWGTWLCEYAIQETTQIKFTDFYNDITFFENSRKPPNL